MSNYIDLRDIIREYDGEDEESETFLLWKEWKEALEENGLDIDEMARNEPILIPEDEMENYAQELAEDMGAIDKNTAWPHTCIDWAWAARELFQDYSQIEVHGTTYYYQGW